MELSRDPRHLQPQVSSPEQWHRDIPGQSHFDHVQLPRGRRRRPQSDRNSTARWHWHRVRTATDEEDFTCHAAPVVSVSLINILIF